MLLVETPFGLSHSYVPFYSSPLTERSINTAPIPRSSRYVSAIMSSTSDRQDAQKPIPFAKRAVKSAPIIKDKDAVREKRRDMFFRKVASNRDEKKWEQRSDQILKLDYMKEQKRWEAEKARSAPTFEQWLEEDDMYEGDVMLSSQQTQAQPWISYQLQSSQSQTVSSQPPEDYAEEAEAMLEYERKELEELAAMVEENQCPPSEHFGSDDLDYDSLFADYFLEQENQAPQFDNRPDYGDDLSLEHVIDAMDTSQ